MPSNSENSEKKEQALTWDTNKQDFINSFLNSGGEIDVEGKKAYMPPGFWNQIDHNQKADVTCVIAQYCEHKKHSGVTYANIYDKMSGKKLAKWSNTTGLTVE